MNRRDFLLQTGLLAVTASFSGVLPGLLNASSPNGKNLVVINLSGGIDVLHLLQPNLSYLHDIRSHYDKGSLSGKSLWRTPHSSNQVGRTNTFYHPSFSILDTLWNDNNAYMFNAAAYDGKLTSSHAEASQAIQSGVSDREGVIDPAFKTGWLNRLVTQNQQVLSDNPDIRSLYLLSLGGTQHVSSGGKYEPTVIGSLEDLKFKDLYSDIAANHGMREVAKIMQEQSSVRKDALRQNQSLLGMEAYSSILNGSTADQKAFGYGSDSMSKQLKDVAKAMLAEKTAVFTTIQSGYDNHANQAGGFSSNISQLNNAITSFRANLKHPAWNRWDDTCIMVFSEFSRTIKMNGGFGTDHGGATFIGLFGGAVKNSNLVGEVRETDLIDKNRLEMKTNIVDIYATIADWLGFEFNGTFDRTPEIFPIFK